MKKLKINILTITTLFLMPMVLKAQDVQPLQLTLDQALEIALSERNTIKIADMTV